MWTDLLADNEGGARLVDQDRIGLPRHHTPRIHISTYTRFTIMRRRSCASPYGR